MNRTLLRLIPVFQEKIWGGHHLRTAFGYDIPSDKTGECWAISAHPHGDCAIANPEFAGETLHSLYKKHPELFGNLASDRFPLLVKIIDAKDDLSIQVHPDNAYAKKNENGCFGKSECWYILDCKPDSSIIIGHNANTKEELISMIDQHRWSELIREIPIQKGDFFQINPGCVHAIKKGTLLLETQMSSDVTYRFYDYDRLENGKPRQLHLEKCIDVTTVPSESATTTPTEWTAEDATFQELISIPQYTVCRVVLNGATHIYWNQSFVNVSILSGEGLFDGAPFKAGDHFIITADYGEMEIAGDIEFIYSHI